MLTVKAKHATMLLTVGDGDGLSDGGEDLSDEDELLPPGAGTATNGAGNGVGHGNAGKQLPAHPSVVMVSGQPSSLNAQTYTNTHTHTHA